MAQRSTQAVLGPSDSRLPPRQAPPPAGELMRKQGPGEASEEAGEAGVSSGKAAAFESLIGEGRAAVGRRDFPRAAQLYSQLIALDPSNHVLFSNRSAIRLQLKHYPEAVRDAQAALKLQPSWPKGHLRLGLALGGSGDWRGALVALGRGLAAEGGASAALLAALVDAARASDIAQPFEVCVSSEPSCAGGGRSGVVVEAAYGELGGLGLERSPFVVLSVVGQELLGAAATAAAAEVLEAALAIGTTSVKLRQSVVSSLSSAYWTLGQREKALACMETDVELARSLGDGEGEATAQGNLGMLFASLGHSAAALAAYQRQLELALPMGKTDLARSALASIGSLQLLLGNYPQALVSHQQALDLLQTSSTLRPEAKARESAGLMEGLGKVHLASADFDDAEACFGRQLELAEASGDRGLVGRALLSQGDLSEKLGRREEALRLFLEALKAARAVKERNLEGVLSGRLSVVCQSLGRWEEAGRWARKQLQIGLSLSEPRMEAAACGNLGRVFAHSADPSNARKLYQRQLSLAEKANDPRSRLAAQRNLGWAEEALGAHGPALEAQQRAADLATELGDSEVAAEAHASIAKLLAHSEAPPEDVLSHVELSERRLPGGAGLGELWLSVGQTERGLAELEAFLMTAQEEGNLDAERKACHSLGQAQASLGRHKEAVRYLDQEVSLAKDLRDHVAMGAAYAALGQSQAALAQYSDALESFKYQLAIAHITADSPAKLTAMTSIGHLLLQRRNLPAALKVLVKALNLAKSKGARRAEALVYGRLGQCYGALKRFEKAFAFYQEMLRLSRSESWPKGEMEAQGLLLAHYQGLGQPQMALKAAQEQVRCAESLKDPRETGRSGWELGRLCADMGLHDDAVRALTSARRQLTSSRLPSADTQLLSDVLQKACDSFRAKRRFLPALYALLELLDSPSASPLPEWSLRSEVGRLWISVGSFASAAQAFALALESGEGSAMSGSEKSEILRELAQAQAGAGDLVGAEESLLLRHEAVVEWGAGSLAESEALLAWLAFRKADAQQSQVHLASAKAAGGPAEALAESLLATMAAREGRWAEAREALRRAAARTSNAQARGQLELRLIEAEWRSGGDWRSAISQGLRSAAASDGDPELECRVRLSRAVLEALEGSWEWRQTQRELEAALVVAEANGLYGRVCHLPLAAPSSSVIEDLLTSLMWAALVAGDGRSCLAYAEKRLFWSSVAGSEEAGVECEREGPEAGQLEASLGTAAVPALLAATLHRGVRLAFVCRSSGVDVKLYPVHHLDDAPASLMSELEVSLLSSMPGCGQDVDAQVVRDFLAIVGSPKSVRLVGEASVGLIAELRSRVPGAEVEVLPSISAPPQRMDELGLPLLPQNLACGALIITDRPRDGLLTQIAETLTAQVSESAEEVVESLETAALVWVQAELLDDGGVLLGAEEGLNWSDIVGAKLPSSLVALVGSERDPKALKACQAWLLAGASRVLLLPEDSQGLLSRAEELSHTQEPIDGSCFAGCLTFTRAEAKERPQESQQKEDRLGTSLRRLLSSPDECREAMRVLAHLCDKARERLRPAAPPKAMYTSLASVAAKVGPEAQGWAELLEEAGFRKELRGTETVLFFPGHEAEAALGRASDVLTSALALPQTSLVALSRLLADDRTLLSAHRLFTSLSSQLGHNSVASHFLTRIPAPTYHSAGVQPLVASVGFDLITQSPDSVTVKTIRLELTKRKVEMALVLLAAMSPTVDAADLNASTASEGLGRTYDQPPQVLSLASRLRDLEVTDMSGVDSDYGSPGKRKRGPRTSTPALNRQGRARSARARPKSGYGAAASGYCSESEGRLRGRKLRSQSSRPLSRGCQSEDEGGRLGGDPARGDSLDDLFDSPDYELTATVLAVDSPLPSPSTPPKRAPPPYRPSAEPNRPSADPSRPSSASSRSGRPSPLSRPSPTPVLASSTQLLNDTAPSPEAQRLRQAAQRLVPRQTAVVSQAAHAHVVTVPPSVAHSTHRLYISPHK